MQDLKKRTKDYALSLVRAYDNLPKRIQYFPLSHQLIRSGTSVGAQYREACRAKSNADFVSKIEGCLQELEESEFWLEVLSESGYWPVQESQRLAAETRELNAMFTAICKSVKGKGKAS
jgi:four helix bundle protein